MNFQIGFVVLSLVAVLGGIKTQKDAKPAKPSALPPAGLSQATAQLPAIPEAAAADGTIPFVMPEKVAKGRYLVELEATEGGAADLAGDAGAVGRFSLSGAIQGPGHMLCTWEYRGFKVLLQQQQQIW